MRNHSASLGVLALVLASPCLAQTWIKMSPTTSPSARWGIGMAYDFIRGHTLLFGGGTGNGNVNNNETWKYDGKTWTQLKPANSPPARRFHTLVNALTRTVMFGGTATTRFTDTWVWDGLNWTQVQTTKNPSGRYAPAMAYDSVRNKVVLFGGFAASGNVADTWEFDFKNWTQITTKNSPSARFTNMAYDAARKRVVLFGGGAGGNVNDTWEYDGTNWKQITTKTTPPARCCYSMTYDSGRKRIVIFGGLNTALLGDTWEYDGTDWIQITPKLSPSNRREWDGMAYDSRRKRVVYFGGTSGALTNETWEYVGSQALTGTPATISIASGGAHNFSLDAGTANASRLYWVFGSLTGTTPGVNLASAAGTVNIPLNPDIWTDLTIALANSPLLAKTRGTLDASGKATATFNVPKITNQSAVGVKFYHAYLVYDAQNNFYMASNPVEVTLVK